MNSTKVFLLEIENGRMEPLKRVSFYLTVSAHHAMNFILFYFFLLITCTETFTRALHYIIISPKVFFFFFFFFNLKLRMTACVKVKAYSVGEDRIEMRRSHAAILDHKSDRGLRIVKKTVVRKRMVILNL